MELLYIVPKSAEAGKKFATGTSLLHSRLYNCHLAYDMICSSKSQNAKRRKHMNIILIGMPGAGKSTLGVLVAKALGMNYIDTDILIQQNESRLLQDIIDSVWY